MSEKSSNRRLALGRRPLPQRYPALSEGTKASLLAANQPRQRSVGPAWSSSASALYKKLIAATEEYAGDVQIIHRAVAVKAATDAMDTAFAEQSRTPSHLARARARRR
jgi:hypothetical protein